MKVRDFFAVLKDTVFEISVPDDRESNKWIPIKIGLPDFGRGSYPLSYVIGTFKFNITKRMEDGLNPTVKEYNTYSDIPNNILNMNLIGVVSMSCGGYISTSQIGNKYVGNSFGFTILVSDDD